LPDEVLDKEIADILEVGIELVTNAKVEKPTELLNKGYDAVLVAVGTHQGSKLPLEGSDLEGVYVNTDFLKKSRQGIKLDIKEKVVVLGGGNVAYDCARTALRLGAKEVHIACLENLDQMTASKDEIEEGKEEGIILHDAYSFLRITGNEKVEGVELQKVDKFYFDENRKAIIELVEGSNEIIAIDSVIFAVGQRPRGTEVMELELTHGPYIKTNKELETNIKGIFAAGDVVTGTKSVISAIAEGRKSAESIDKYLGGDGEISEQLLEVEKPNPFIGRCPGFSKLDRVKPELVDAKIRKSNFQIVEKTFSKEDASCEASRCLQCDLRLNITKPKLWNEY
jgi:NADPH-dependent glutamate synthase beta subunit-like oxidoreductase